MCVHMLELTKTPVDVVQNVNCQLFGGIVCERTKLEASKCYETLEQAHKRAIVAVKRK